MLLLLLLLLLVEHFESLSRLTRMKKTTRFTRNGMLLVGYKLPGILNIVSVIEHFEDFISRKGHAIVISSDGKVQDGYHPCFAIHNGKVPYR